MEIVEGVLLLEILDTDLMAALAACLPFSCLVSVPLTAERGVRQPVCLPSPAEGIDIYLRTLTR